MAVVNALVVETIYDPQEDMVFWVVQTPDDRMVTLAWKRKYFGETFRYKGEIPPNVVADFIERDVKGKRFNIDLGGAGPADPEIFK